MVLLFSTGSKPIVYVCCLHRRARCASLATSMLSSILAEYMMVVRNRFLQDAAVVDLDPSNTAYAVAVAH